MVKFTQLLHSPENIRHGVLASSKKRLLAILSEMMECNGDDVDRRAGYKLLENLCDREKIGTTALGGGVALPHAKIAANRRVQAIFLQLANSVDYGASDNKEVDLVFALFVPENQCTLYTILLSEIAQYLQQKSLLKQLRSAQTRDELWTIFEQFDRSIQELEKQQNDKIDSTKIEQKDD